MGSELGLARSRNWARARAGCLWAKACGLGSDARATYLLGVEPTELAVVTLDRRVPRRDRGGVGHLVRARVRVRVTVRVRGTVRVRVYA